MKTLHVLSLAPFDTLIQSYTSTTSNNNSNTQQEDENVKYSNLEMLTSECGTKWELTCVKRSFELAKTLFTNEQIHADSPDTTTDDLQPPDYSNPQTFDPTIESGQLISPKAHLNVEDTLKNNDNNGVSDDDDEDDEATVTRNDDRNFYRNFTLKLAASKNLFADDYSQSRYLNLNCFVSSLKLHTKIVGVLRQHVGIAHEATSFRDEFMRMLALTYLTGIKIDRLLSFKILLTKVFYLNLENNLANFVRLTKLAFLSQCELLYEYLSGARNEPISVESGQLDEIEIEFDKLARSSTVISAPRYFGLFIAHFSKYYLYLNEKTHNSKLDDVYLNTLMDKYEREEESGGGGEQPKRDEVIELFRVHKEHNKALTMLTLTKITQTALSKSGESPSSANSNHNDLAYIRKDFRYRYQTWSFRMISRFLNGLNEHERRVVEDEDEEEKMGESSVVPKCVRKSIAQVIVVFNSCSSYCQCSVSAFFPADADPSSHETGGGEGTPTGLGKHQDHHQHHLQSVKNTSVKLLSSILSSLRRKQHQQQIDTNITDI